MTDERGAPGEGWSTERQAIYRELLARSTDPDALHDLLLKRGPALLDASVPYLIVSARNMARSNARREHRRTELEERKASEDGSKATARLDPSQLVVGNDALAEATDVLAQLDPKYSWPLWWHAAGYTDPEIVRLWEETGMQPQRTSPELVRKWRERGRALLRARLTSG